jgi:hypothetical protein
MQRRAFVGWIELGPGERCIGVHMGEGVHLGEEVDLGERVRLVEGFDRGAAREQ